MDQLGTTSALTTLSPILPGRIRQLRNRLKVVRFTPGMGRPLLQLAFIHYARWIILDGLPPSSGSGGWRGLRWQYLLFESNFDGGQADYLRTFADVVPARLAKLWGACFGFATKTGASARDDGSGLAPFGFRTFVEQKPSSEILDFYAAYPDSTAIDVRQAIAMHELLADATRSPNTEWLTETATVALGPVSPSLTVRQHLQAIYDPWRSAVRGHYGVNPISIVTPLSESQESRLRDACRNATPLAGLSRTETHFARLVIVPRSLTDLGQPDPDVLDTSYLLYTSDSWGTAYEHIEALRTVLGTTADLMWQGCDGYPGHDGSPAQFHAWVDSRTLCTRYYVAGISSTFGVSDQISSGRACPSRSSTYAAEQHPAPTQLLAQVEPDSGRDG